MTEYNSSFGILSEAKYLLDQEPERKKSVNDMLLDIDHQYQGISEVYHVAHVLHQKIGPAKNKRAGPLHPEAA